MRYRTPAPRDAAGQAHYEVTLFAGDDASIDQLAASAAAPRSFDRIGRVHLLPKLFGIEEMTSLVEELMRQAEVAVG